MKNSKIMSKLVVTILVILIVLSLVYGLTLKMTENIFYQGATKATYDTLFENQEEKYAVYFYDGNNISRENQEEIDAWAKDYGYGMKIYLVDTSEEENASAVGEATEIGATEGEVKVTELPTLVVFETDSETSTKAISEIITGQENIMTYLQEMGPIILEETTKQQQ